MPLALLLVLVIAMVFTAAYGWTVERIAYRPLRGSFRLAPLISAIGMSIFLQNYVQLLQGARVKTAAAGDARRLRPDRADGFVVQVSYLQIIIIALTVVADGGLHLMSSPRRRSAGRSAPASRT